MAQKKADEKAPKGSDNLRWWSQMDRPPEDALRPILKGRLKGKSDINPQWRIKAMTEVFGPCGFGWKYEVKKFWLETAELTGEQFAFAEIDLYVKDPDSGEWSDAIPGSGGYKFVVHESSGPHASDECYKASVTDALSVAMKQIGVAADVYAGLWDGSKYADQSDDSDRKNGQREKARKPAGRPARKPAKRGGEEPEPENKKSNKKADPTDRTKKTYFKGMDLSLNASMEKLLNDHHDKGLLEEIDMDWVKEFIKGAAKKKKKSLNDFCGDIVSAKRQGEFFEWMVDTIEMYN